METRIRSPRRRATAVAAALGSLPLVLACSESRAAAPDAGAPQLASTSRHPADPASPVAPEASAEDVLPTLEDAPLAAYRAELLELAYDAASAFPLHPHVKNRSRAQERAVEVALELEQPARALRYADGIANWRRGLGYASVALHAAERGDEANARLLLERAQSVLDGPHDENEQAWRLDRIRVRMAGTLLALGDAERASELQAGVVESESEGFRIDAERALRMADDDFDARFAELDGVLMTGGFEQARGALEACTELHDRFYGDEDRRFLLEERVRSGWSSVPTDVRIDLLGRLAESAIGHGDRSKALGLVDEAQALIDGAHWTMQHRLPLVARNAALRFRAGQEDRARGQVDAALAAFEADPEAIVNMFRGEALRPLAEAYHAMGLTPMAHAVYTRVLEEAVVNRNSRPRAIDLSETCLSLALHAIEPTDALAARLREIAGALGDPW